MSDSVSDADKIRNKRLAKLGSQNTSSDSAVPPSSASQPATPASHSTSAENTTAKNDVKPVTDAPEPNNPFSKLGIKQQDNLPPQTSMRPNPQPSAPQQARSPSRQKDPPKTKSFEEWQDDTLSGIFRFTVHPEKTKDAHGHRQYLLNGVRAEREEAKGPIRLDTDLLGDAILEAASDQGKTTPLEYLLECWKRVSRTWRTYRTAPAEDPKLHTVKEARRMCMSYCIFAITMPDMFGQEPPSDNPLAKHLLVDPENDRGVCHDFLTEAVSRFDEDESVKEALVGAVEQLSSELSHMTMNDNYKPYVMALRSFSRFPALVTALSESAVFLPADTAAQDIEKKTLLGPFFQISPLQGEVAANYFSSPKTRDRGNIANSQNALRLTLQTHQNELFDVVDRFIKSSKSSRERTLDWFALCVNANHKRRAIQTDQRYISSDGFMVNVTVCLDMLSEPFMDAAFSKINRIESEYFRRSPRVEIKDETKINADQSMADAFYAKKVDGTSNFISEVFFLTVAAHHYGTEAANSNLSRLRKELKHLDKQIEQIEGERQKYIANPILLTRFEQALKKYKEQAERGHCISLALEGVLLDDLSQARSMSFMRYIIVWLMRVVSGVDFPRQAVTLPLSPDQSEVFKNLPEYFLEDVVDHFKFVTSHMPHVISPTQCDELVMICITFLRSSDYVKNPYLKSGLVTILCYGSMPTRISPKGVLGDVLNALPFALKHLLHAVMQFYIECESTGAHTQFYDKFNIRWEIFQVVKCIWGNVVYRDNLAAEARSNIDFFVRFVNMMLNDVTFVLDESLSSFHKISSISRELRDHGSGMEESVKTEKEEALDDAQRKAKSYMSLTNESVATLKLFTDALADAFTSQEIVQRLADMLDYNLESLVGPKSKELKIENPQEYGFNPKALLSDIMDVYLNLSGKSSFHVAIARDGRSYKDSNFTQAASIMARFGLKSSEELARWKRLEDAVSQAKEADEAEDEDFADAPEEFFDPLLSTLMQDPVILPISKNIIDRSTIRQHLLSDSHDPFNRTPLKIEDVIPDTEMKARIEAFKAEKKAAKQAKAVDSANAMDTTP